MEILKKALLIIQNNKNIYNIATIGEGIYKSWKDGKRTKSFDTWHDMIKRCYSNKNLNSHPTYEDKYVCEDWLNYQNFGEWFTKNYYEISGERMQLDKDILNKGNRIYDTENCCFVPNRINALFTKRQNKRGQFPIGVTYDKKRNKYKANCSFEESQKYLGSYGTSEEAFNSYKQFKEKYIKEIADEYKYKIPIKLYKAMHNYKVEITD